MFETDLKNYDGFDEIIKCKTIIEINFNLNVPHNYEIFKIILKLTFYMLIFYHTERRKPTKAWDKVN